MVKPMVHSQKHYVQQSLFTVTAGALSNINLISGTVVADKNVPREVEEGSTVKAIYLEYWINTNDTTPGTNIIVLLKRSGNEPILTVTDSALLQDYLNKKNVFYVTMGLTNPNTSTAIPVLRQWIKIPKSKQRFGLGDSLSISFHAQTGTMKVCGFACFKEYV